MKNILIVDDSLTIRKMIQASLQPQGPLAFEEAVNGLDAIEKLALRAADLILLDMNMPEMNGLDVLRFLRDYARYRDIPVIMLTTKGDETTRNECLAAGASLYLTKPFEPAALAHHVASLLHQTAV